MNVNTYKQLEGRELQIRETSLNTKQGIQVFFEVNDSCNNSKGAFCEVGNSLYRSHDEALEGIEYTKRDIQYFSEFLAREQAEEQEQENSITELHDILKGKSGKMYPEFIRPLLDRLDIKLPLKYQKCINNMVWYNLDTGDVAYTGRSSIKTFVSLRNWLYKNVLGEV